MRIEADAVVQATNIGHYIGQWVPLKQEGRDLVGVCPLHNEKTGSLHVHIEERYFKCFGCGAGGDVIKFAQLHLGIGFQEALRAVADFSGITGGSDQPRRLAPPAQPAEREAVIESPRGPCVAKYLYTDAAGNYLHEVWRFEPGKNGRKKDFSQGYRGTDGEMVWKGYPDPVLYRLPAVTSASEVILCEGEKDAETCERLGYVGTTPPAGSNAVFTASMAESLAGKTVYLMPDNDEAGEKRGKQLAAALRGKAHVVVFRSRVGKDITDWVDAAGVAEVTAAIEALRTETARERLKGLLSVEQIMERVEGGAAAFADPTRRPKGLMTGFSRIDDMTLGMFPGDLIIVAGRPGMGKTALAMNIAVNITKAENPVAVSIFSLEMSSEQLLTRMVCAEAYINAQAFRANYLTQDERSRFGRILGKVSTFPLRIDDHSAASVKYMRSQLEGQKSGLVVVDYLGLMTGQKAENRVQQVSAITRELKLLAKDLRAPVMLVAQLNRSTETRPAGGNVPQLSDLRESGSIEQDADQVWFIYRPEYYKPEREELRGIAEIIIAKQRNGPVGKVKLAWLGQYTKFEDLAADREHGEGI